MAVGLNEPEKLLPVTGVRSAAIAAGIKSSGAPDLVLFEMAESSRCAAVFTQNIFCAAPVVVAKQHLSSNTPRYLLINSGNANAGTGQQGIDAALETCSLLAASTSCETNQVLPFSTGVIGENLDLSKFRKAIPELVSQLAEDAWIDAGRGIMTTDTLLKGRSKQIVIDGQQITLTGVSKGSGMIRPDMATMLAFIATDASISQQLLDQCLQTAVNRSFNAITVDGDTSTNDACVLIATGQATHNEITEAGEQFHLLQNAVNEICEFLAQAIIRDGEGASKFITLKVCHAASEQTARQVAYTIAHSPLVKTALFASDPNWGRILAAVGRSGVDMDIDKIRLYLDDVCIVKEGGRSADYTEEQGQKVMSQDEITIKVDLQQGDAAATIWTSDLSYEYVKINAEYRS
ncbi:MAG: bifunctional glutamate N-acetyltransferase/amino-acid acetyltransferase ArgJ [Gammaproteobacteria bacterium]|nr:bifunctional glutamate N-acetyltransferase/amino-acid acetyltransferase ArgJ [Gammaproteobacteria bacterium]